MIKEEKNDYCKFSFYLISFRKFNPLSRRSMEKHKKVDLQNQLKQFAEALRGKLIGLKNGK